MSITVNRTSTKARIRARVRVHARVYPRQHVRAVCSHTKGFNLRGQRKRSCELLPVLPLAARSKCERAETSYILKENRIRDRVFDRALVFNSGKKRPMFHYFVDVSKYIAKLDDNIKRRIK